MAYSSENSCKKGCSCDSCKSSHKNTQSEGFKQKAAELVRKTFDYGRDLAMRTSTTPGVDDHAAFGGPGQTAAITAGVHAANDLANVVAPHIKKAGEKIIDTARKYAPLATAVAENSNYIGSEEHYKDLVYRHKTDIDNFKKERDPYARQYLQHIAQKSLQNVQNHPLHSKQPENPIKEDLNAPTSLPSDYVTHVFSFREGQEAKHVGTWNGDKFTANDPDHPVYGDNGSYRKNNRRAPSATTMRDPHQGPPNEVHVVEKPNKELDKNDKHSVNHWHEHHTSMATMYDSLAKTTGTAKEKYEWRKKAAHHQDEAMKVRPEFYTNSITGKPKEPHHVKDFEKWTPKPKETSDEKKAEDMLKEEDKSEDSNSNLKDPESMADYHHSKIVSPKKAAGETYETDKKEAPKPKENPITNIKPGKTGEEVKQMKEDKYAKLAEAAFGSLNKNNPFRNASSDDDYILNEVGDTEKGREMLKKVAARAVEKTANKAVKAPGYPYDKKALRAQAIKKGQETVNRATDRLADRGYKPREESINQRFPDVERDIAAIMKESYKKKKMMEDATNIQIATPEQRNDWLDVGRGSMDIADYINKYKV